MTLYIEGTFLDVACWQPVSFNLKIEALHFRFKKNLLRTLISSYQCVLCESSPSSSSGDLGEQVSDDDDDEAASQAGFRILTD